MNFFWSNNLSYRKRSFHTTSKEISDSKRRLPQIIAVFIKNTVLIVYGTSVGMSTILVGSLSGLIPDESVILNETGISWIASLNHLCVPIGCLLSGLISKIFGRKRALQLVSIPFLVAFILYYFSTKSWHVFLGLTITGISGGLCEAPALSYTVEVAEPTVRGALTSTSTLFISIGILFTFILGSFFQWRTVSIINAFIPLVAILLLMWIPETPYWLISKTRLEEGQKNLAWLRGWTTPDRVQKEFLEIQEYIRKNTAEESAEDLKTYCNSKTLRLYTKARFIKPFLLTLFSFIIGHFGVSPITVYAVPIFNLVQIPISSYYATVLIGCINLISCSICVVTVRLTGKRTLAFISLVGVCICFNISASYSYLMGIYNFNSTPDISNTSFTWVPLVSLVTMGSFSYLLIFSLPWMLMGEIYYNEIRDVATGISAGLGYLIGFIANKTFLDMVLLFSLPGVFWIYSGVAAVGFIGLYFLLPETEGKTLFDISEHYNGGDKLDNNVLRHKK